MSPAKWLNRDAIEAIEMPFGMWTLVGQRNHALHGVQIPTHEGAILRAKKNMPRYVRHLIQVNKQEAAWCRC